MTKIFYKSAAATLMALLTSCDGSSAPAFLTGASKVPSGGFKSVKFSSDATELRALGFDCGTDQRKCKKAAGGAQPQTLFGLPADVDVELEGGKVRTILVSIGMEPQKLVETYEKELGASKVFEYTAMTHAKMREHYWVSPEGTSISVPVNLTPDRQDQWIYQLAGPRAHAYYNDKRETTASLARIQNLSVKPKDF